MANRGYKLQEFTAHTSRVNCLNIGKKSCRVFLTGGEDHKVNLWAIGKPTSLLSLSGHTSSVQSVTFDSAEVLVLGGSSNGTIKLWDLEEGKIVRTVTGHRANCISVDFHPFGEFFASGSVDTDLKIWDIRKKGCIHTYKGHSRGIRTIKFTPDGRWVVTGGEDNVVKLWDLTAGKLLHDFKFHCGPIQCIDFHPHEFLLATGSADRTVKFLDLETFELIGSAGPQASGIRSMVFHPDGKTLFAGLDETLKVLSWEPIICHDIVEMGWSTLGDLGVYEGKLLGCSYYQSRVGVWVADISLIKPYDHGIMPKANSFVEPVYNHGDHHPIGPAMNDTYSALLVEGTPDCGINTKDAPKNPCIISNESCQRIIQGPDHSPNLLPMNSSRFRRSSSSVNSHSDPSKFDSRFSSKKSMNSATVRCGKPTEILAVTPSKSESNFASRVVPLRSTAIHSISPSTLKNGAMVDKRSVKKTQAISRSVSLPFIVPRDSLEAAASYKKVTVPTGATHGAMHSKPCNMLKSSFVSDSGVSQPSETIFEPLSGIVGDTVGTGSSLLSRLAINTGTTSADENKHSSAKTSAEELKTSMQMDRTIDLHNNKSSELPCSSSESGLVKYVRGVAVPLGKTKSLVESWEKRERCNSSNISTISSSDEVPKADNLSSVTKGQCQTSEVGVASADDHAVPEALLQSHDVFINVVKSRLTKLQVVRHFWEHNGIKGAVNAVAKLPDHSVQLDLICILKKRIDLCTLDLFACLLPVLAGLINSKTERHIIVCLEMLLELVKIFGPTINSTLSASSLVGLDYQVEQRSECCKRCFNHLDKIQKTLPLLIRRGGLLGKHAQALTLLLNDL